MVVRLKNRNCIRADTSPDTEIVTLNRPIYNRNIELVREKDRSIEPFAHFQCPFLGVSLVWLPPYVSHKVKYEENERKVPSVPLSWFDCGANFICKCSTVKLHYTPWAGRRNRIWFWTTVGEELWHLRHEMYKIRHLHSINHCICGYTPQSAPALL